MSSPNATNTKPFPSSPGPPPGRPSSSHGNRYYSSHSAKPFSKSAAKRSSVMALGSIAHLQHFYVKNGLSNPERVNASARRSPMTLALPGHSPTSPGTPLADPLDLPPSPMPPEPRERLPFIEVEPVTRDLKELRREVMGSLEEVCKMWGLVEYVKLTARPSRGSFDGSTHPAGGIATMRSISPSPRGSTSSPIPFDRPLSPDPDNIRPLSYASNSSGQPQSLVLTLLHTTTSAIRSVQKYVLTLPSDAFSSRSTSDTSSGSGSGGNSAQEIGHRPRSSPLRDSLMEVNTAQLQKYNSSMGITTSSRTRATMLGPSSSLSPSGRPSSSPASGIAGGSGSGSGGGRRSLSPRGMAALAEQAGGISPGEDGMLMMDGGGGGGENPLTVLRKESLEVLGALKDMEVRYRIPGSGPDADSDLTPEEAQELHDSFNNNDDSGSSGGGGGEITEKGYEYKTEIGLQDLSKEAETVRHYVELVDKILFREEKKKKHRVSKKPSPKSILGLPQLEQSKSTRGRDSSISSRRRGHIGNLDSLAEQPLTEEPEEEDAETGIGVGHHHQEPEIKITADGDEIGDDEEGDESDGEEIPEWAKPGQLENEPLRRAHVVLAAHLSTRVIFHLGAPHGDGTRQDFLDSLQDGTLLCLSYNNALRKSQRPWGFIQPQSIHDLVSPQGSSHISQHNKETSSEDSRPKSPATPSRGERRVGLTFRRVENLRVWAAALKLRYLINLSPQQGGGGGGNKSPTRPSTVIFDPKIVARRDPGWEEMLEYAVLCWVDALVNETRAEGVASL